MNNDDAEIAAFHRAARKRKAWIFGIAAIVSLIAGVLAIVISFSVEDPRTGGRFEIKTIVVGGLLVVAGLSMAWTAYRIGIGEIADVEE